RERHTRFSRDWSSDVCSSDLRTAREVRKEPRRDLRVIGDDPGLGRARGGIDHLVAVGQPQETPVHGHRLGGPRCHGLNLLTRKVCLSHSEGALVNVPDFFSEVALALHEQSTTEKTVDLITQYAQVAAGSDEAGIMLVHNRARVETAS